MLNYQRVYMILMIYLFFGSKSCSFPTLAFHLPHPGIYDLHRAIYAAFCYVLLARPNKWLCTRVKPTCKSLWNPMANPMANMSVDPNETPQDFGSPWNFDYTSDYPKLVVLRLILGLHWEYGHYRSLRCSLDPIIVPEITLLTAWQP